jgi:hypothetical protein
MYSIVYDIYDDTLWINSPYLVSLTINGLWVDIEQWYLHTYTYIQNLSIVYDVINDNIVDELVYMDGDLRISGIISDKREQNDYIKLNVKKILTIAKELENSYKHKQIHLKIE